MLWLLRTLPLALAVGAAVGLGAAYAKATKRVALLEWQLANAQQAAKVACVPAREEFQPAKLLLTSVAPLVRAPERTAPCPVAPAISRPAPAAPRPLPFTYVGRMIDGGNLQVFVARGDATYSVSPGMKIGDYRVERVSPSQVAFLHLPSRTRQILETSAVSE